MPALKPLRRHREPTHLRRIDSGEAAGVGTVKMFGACLIETDLTQKASIAAAVTGLHGRIIWPHRLRVSRRHEGLRVAGEGHGAFQAASREDQKPLTLVQREILRRSDVPGELWCLGHIDPILPDECEVG